MKTMYFFIGVSPMALGIMVVVDFMIGTKAQFLNAYSVLQRLTGQRPSASESLIAQKLGAAGEFGVVLASSLAVGVIVSAIMRLYSRQR